MTPKLLLSIQMLLYFSFETIYAVHVVLKRKTISSNKSCNFFRENSKTNIDLGLCYFEHQGTPTAAGGFAEIVHGTHQTKWAHGRDLRASAYLWWDRKSFPTSLAAASSGDERGELDGESARPPWLLLSGDCRGGGGGGGGYVPGRYPFGPGRVSDRGGATMVPGWCHDSNRASL